MPDHPEIETVHPDADVEALRQQTRELCAQFPDEYWRETDRNRRYPQEFVDTLTAAGLLSALSRPSTAASGLEPDQGQRDHGGDQQVRRALGRLPRPDVHHGRAAASTAASTRRTPTCPVIAKGELRLQAFSITEDAAGSDTTSIITAAVADGDDYVITGAKNWTSRIEESDLALVLARTSDKGEPTRPAG